MPTVEYKNKYGIFKYCFKNTVFDFTIPVRFFIDDKEVWLNPSTEWQKLTLPSETSTIRIDENFYIDFLKK